jgi:signal peptidase I
MIVNNEAFFKDIKEIIKTTDVKFKVKGSSMWPFFKDGITSVTLTKVEKLKKLDVCLFNYKDKYFLHRLIKIKDNDYIFKGDGLSSKEIVKKEDIIARVKSYENKKEIDVEKKSYKLRVLLYRLLPRKIILKVFK